MRVSVEVGADFERWAAATAMAAGSELVRQLTAAGSPASLGGRGAPRSTGRGYRSQYVTFKALDVGEIAVWLYVVPPGHEYGTGNRNPQVCAGLMNDSNWPLEREVLALRSRHPFFWRTLNGRDWTGYWLACEADLVAEPEAAGEQLVERVMQGLRAARLIR